MKTKIKKNQEMKLQLMKSLYFKIATSACSLILLLGCSLNAQETTMAKIEKNTPKNWGKWGTDDRIGALNYLDEAQTLRGVKAVKTGKRFTLQLPMTHGVGPVFPGRVPVEHFMSQDESSYASGKKEPLAGGMKYSDDAVFMYLQGTSHVDALGHAWYGDKLWGGKSANNTIGGHDFVDVGALGEKGITGRGVLIDVGLAMGDAKGRLAPNTCIGLDDIKAVAKKQGVTIQKRDILVIRTGSMGRFYDEDDKQNWDALTEPGLCYSKELVQWVADMEIPVIAADNLAVEKAAQDINGETAVIPLHGALIRDLGVVLTEIYWLDELSEDCKKDKQYTFFFTASPLKMKRGSGSPVNPIVIK
ncbi:cyclase family protein [Flagellimonas sp.]|uniref:cyclase family protein n=1 Tax=Flagellimonas sp. TaxID=2058762 RepID=UPI003BA96282